MSKPEQFSVGFDWNESDVIASQYHVKISLLREHNWVAVPWHAVLFDAIPYGAIVAARRGSLVYGWSTFGDYQLSRTTDDTWAYVRPTMDTPPQA